MTLVAGDRLAAFEILGSIGKGAMGEVYLARDTKLERKVAVKVLPGELAEDADFRARFEREAKALAALSHPNILAIHDFGSAHGHYYAVTELLEGETLGSILKRGPLPERKAVDFTMQLARGLSAAHGKGIVHRDLKPENLFITSDGRLKILDFGLAKVETPFDDDGDSETIARGTKLGTVLGTVGYMSPEQVRGREADSRSDLFSLGAVLYEMLLGKAPFAGESAADVVSGILNAHPSIPASARIQPGLVRIATRCLEKNPEERFQSARDLAFALETMSGIGRDPAPPEPREEAHSIAVLPFVDMSPRKDQEYFCEGMAEEIMNALAGLPGLRVAARSSAFRFKGGGQDLRDVGRALGVATVLEGSVRTAGNRLRVTAQLNEVQGNYQIWSRRYDRELEDVFAVQDEIAADIVEALRLELGSADSPRIVRHTTNQEAYDLYLRGRHHWYARSKGALSKALGYFEQAAAKDLNYALPHIGISDLYAVQAIYAFLPEEAARARAKASLDRALALNDRLSEAQRALGFYRLFFEWDVKGAVAAWERSVELDPASALAHIWLAFNAWPDREDASIAALKRAIELDPLDLYVNSVAGLILGFWGSHEDALRACQKALDLDPNYLVGLYAAGGAYSQLGRHDEALEVLGRSVMNSSRAPFNLAYLGWAQARAGLVEDARALLDELTRRAENEYVAPLFLAVIVAALGDVDRAFDLLEQAVEKRNCWVIVPRFPWFDAFRSDPRFTEHLKRIGHPDV
ncbi:MAG TPA: protein kinase [Vicinamibacteria bacterium]|nr:protein kinase [Vicinamibacteria bacterium]